MAFQTVNMDLSALENITSPNISISDVSWTSIVSSANTSSDGYLIFSSLFIIAVVLYLILTDNTAFQDFGYDYLRGLNISLATCVLIGSTMVETGWSTNFYAVGFFTTLWFLSGIGILVIENKE